MFLYFYFATLIRYNILLSRKFLPLVLISVSTAINAQEFNTIDYQESDENFPNPGRGFYHAVDNIDYDNVISFRDEGISLVFKTYRLDDFKNGQISLGFLNNMKSDFAIIRKAGAKMIVRFSYTYKSSPPYGDAPLSIVLNHIEQLKPVLKNNSDVILVLQAGFIGAWGEWYYTDYFSQSPGVITEENWNNRREMTDSLLEMMPPDIMVQVRTPDYKRHLLELEDFIPVSVNQAFSEAYIARIAHHNDCFLANSSDMGTYQDTLIEKPYLAEDSKYTIVGGETCGQSSLSHCENAVGELKRFHWTFLNRDYHLGVIGDWIDEGCYDDILLKLGYRYRLINATIQNESRPGGNFILNLNMWNDGWANPSNPQLFRVILRNTYDSSEYYVDAVRDMRFFPFDDTITISLEAGMPYNLAEGDYDVFLQITDADPLLTDRPEYSMQLANFDVWNEESGYNSLQHSLSVTQNGGEIYFGCNFFKAQKSIVVPAEIIVDGETNDWDEIPVLCFAQNQDAELLKAYNTADTLNFFIKGNEMDSGFRFFINSDNDTATGFTSPEWPGKGSDYMVENNSLMVYSGDSGQFEWELIQNINIAQNDTVIEVSVPVAALQGRLAGVYGLGAVVDYENVGNKSIFPQSPDDILSVNINGISGPPAFIKSKNLGNINVIYWTKNKNRDNTIAFLQRSETPNGDFETIYSCRNKTISYFDKDLTENQTYYYRLQYKYGGSYSPFSGTIEQITGNSVTNHFISINLDGLPQDWAICPPVATGIVDNEMAAVRFFNDSDSLFFSIESYIGSSYSLYFNINNVMGFDYVLRNDSLYSVSETSLIYIKTIPSYQGDDFLESGFKLNDIQMDTMDVLYAGLFIGQQQLWDKEQGFEYMKYEVMSEPAGFGLEPSVTNPYSRIKVKWNLNSNPAGYIIERSIGDSLHLEELVELQGNKFYYLDDGLDSSLTYYYRMYSFKDLIRSNYTEVKWMKPGTAGIYDLETQAVNVSIMPNPLTSSAIIDISLKRQDNIVVSLLTITGEKISEIYSGKIAKNKKLPLLRGKNQGGIYLLEVKGNTTLIHKKIVFN